MKLCKSCVMTENPGGRGVPVSWKQQPHFSHLIRATGSENSGVSEVDGKPILDDGHCSSESSPNDLLLRRHRSDRSVLPGQCSLINLTKWKYARNSNFWSDYNLSF
ncbi:unnamed protein product [Schistosoma intercalatum]|nr:unnamed protein product [Schistosoma intercalatum]CAH8495115.1 unnamed protein product [Schistosoma intercalatum]